MPKIEIRLPSGLEVRFEGDDDTFEQFRTFLIEDLEPIVNKLGGRVPQAGLGPEEHGHEDGNGEPGRDALEPRALGARLREVGATTDIERVTVMAQAAVDAGLDGLDYPTVDRLYGQLAIRKPKTWRATFSNAKQKGYVENVGQGRWRPTVPGENFARYGHKIPSPPRSKRPAGEPAEVES